MEDWKLESRAEDAQSAIQELIDHIDNIEYAYEEAQKEYSNLQEKYDELEAKYYELYDEMDTLRMQFLENEIAFNKLMNMYELELSRNRV